MKETFFPAMKQYDALAMFSGGLDSILAAKTVAGQGLRVLGLHFVSPFFGHPDKVAHWSETYGLDIETVDVGEPFVTLLASRPPHGVGKCLNPCVDCKILMLRRCKELMPEYGAKMILTGEVKGQRPMSQRRDALDVISREAGVRDVLLRPLSAKNMKPSPAELDGLVDREKLHNFNGRTRKPQFALAKRLGITEYPQPAGGCKLTILDSAKRYVPLFEHAAPPRAADFHLANVGRQFWAGPYWLAMGRNQEDNAALAELAQAGDILLDVKDLPSPFGLIRPLPGADWSRAALEDAAALLASYSPKAVAATGSGGGTVTVLATRGGETAELDVVPERASRLGLAELDWESCLPAKRALFGEGDQDDGY